MLPNIQRPLPQDEILRYRVFAKALLDGEVFPALRAFAACLLVKTTLLLHGAKPKVLGLVQALSSARIGSKASLASRWSRSPAFLLEETLRLLPAPQEKSLRSCWPPLQGKKAAAKA